jgi:hypothetical protein
MIRLVDGTDPRIVRAPLDAELILITGPPGSGKSTALAQRYAALVAAHDPAPEATLVASSHPAGARDLGRASPHCSTSLRARRSPAHRSPA